MVQKDKYSKTVAQMVTTKEMNIFPFAWLANKTDNFAFEERGMIFVIRISHFPGCFCFLITCLKAIKFKADLRI